MGITEKILLVLFAVFALLAVLRLFAAPLIHTASNTRTKSSRASCSSTRCSALRCSAF